MAEPVLPQPVVTLDAFELGQLYAVLGPQLIGKLSPEFRRKLKGAFEGERQSTPNERPASDAYYYAVDDERIR